MRISILALLFAVPAAAQPADSTLALIPQPRQVVRTHDVTLKRGISIELPPGTDDRFAARDLGDALRADGIRVVYGGAASARVELVRQGTARGRALLSDGHVAWSDSMNAEGYAIVALGDRLAIVGRTAAGIFYGAQTVKQLVTGQGPSAVAHLATVRDWPAMRYRGFHDDLSRGPMPTPEFQKYQIRTLAAYKVNVFSPYFENTLYYSENPVFAPPGGAMTPDQVRDLVTYAARYHIDVIPEQEAFGHLHHIL
ncbi:MAG: glycoside hydrolase, partial [Gemmatimonadota bacterium]|nr:glycoside hydrolase [Gemmatimonadota bacterium]